MAYINVLQGTFVFLTVDGTPVRGPGPLGLIQYIHEYNSFVSYSHRAKHLCPILTGTIKCVLFSLFAGVCWCPISLGRSCPFELLRLGKRSLMSIVHFKQMSNVSYSTSYQFICVLSKTPPKLPQEQDLVAVDAGPGVS